MTIEIAMRLPRPHYIRARNDKKGMGMIGKARLLRRYASRNDRLTYFGL